MPYLDPRHAGNLRRHWSGERTMILRQHPSHELVRAAIDVLKESVRDHDLPSVGIDPASVRFRVNLVPIDAAADLLVVRFHAIAADR